MAGHTIAFLLLDVAVVIAAARVGGRIARALRQPAVVGEIAAGILLGPSLLGLLPGNPDEWLFPADTRPLLGALAQIGLVLFMFIVGLELDLGLAHGRERAAAWISLLSIAAPFALGVGLAVVVHPGHDVIGGETIPFLGLALFLGIAMSVTAFPVLARILTDRRMQRTVPGVFSLAAAAVDDIVAWSLLAFVIAVIQGGSPAAVGRILGLTLVYVAVMLLAVRPLLRRLVDWRARAGRLTPDLLAVVLIGVFCSAAVTDVVGIHQIFGAFLFGAIMPTIGASELRHEILDRIEQVAVLLLLPMFFVVTGLAVDFSGITGTGLWQLGLVLLVAMGGKFVGAYAGSRIAAIPSRQSAAIAVLMNTRGLTELIVLSAGRELGVLDDELFAILVVMALVTTIVTEPLLRVVYPDAVVAKDIEAAERRALAEAGEHRVLVVVDDPARPVAELEHRFAGRLACARGADVVLAGLVPAPAAGLPDFAAMATAVENLEALGGRLAGRRSVSTLARFTADPAADLEQSADSARADLVVVGPGFTGVLTTAPMLVLGAEDAFAAAAGDPDGDRPVVCLADDSRSGRTAIVVAAGLALAGSGRLVVATPQSRRKMVADLAPLVECGVAVSVVDWRRRSDAARDGDVIVAAGAEADVPGVPSIVVDRTLTSEESLADRVAARFATHPTRAAAQDSRDEACGIDHQQGRT